MAKIDKLDYPKNADWENKAFSMPNIPRGDGGLIAVLREILTQITDNVSPTKVIKFKGSTSNANLGELCIRLRPMKLVVKTSDGWKLTEYAKRWLNSGDDAYLAAVLCANVKFLGEILYWLSTPKKSSQLQKIANDKYGLSWKTLSDINSRLLWLRAFGFVSFQNYSLEYAITKEGTEFLKNIDIMLEHVADFNDDETFEEKDLDVSSWAIDIYKRDIKEPKKQSIGYIPGSLVDFDITIKDYLELISGGTLYDVIASYSNANFNLSHSSTKSFLTTLVNMGLIERKDEKTYALSQYGDEWLDKCDVIDLIFIMQGKFAFVFDLLNYIKHDAKTFKELSAIAKVTNSFEKENVSEIRKRITILKKAKLIKDQANKKFIATQRGLNLLEKIHMEEPIALAKKTDTAKERETSLPVFLADLRLSTTDSYNYEHLEKNVAQAFKLLGFSAKWIGGSGNTDVLVHATTLSGHSFTVAVDAKSTQTGNVTDGLVDFDTLAEHKKKHNADYSAIVGGAFQNERLIKRATEHNVVLIDIDSFENMILKQADVPLKASAYKKIFENPGLVDITVLDEERNTIIRYGKLMRLIISCLAEESEDSVTQGVLSNREIYRSLRDNDEFSHSPTLEEISNMLELLSSPLVGCVGKSSDGYYALANVADTAKKFDFYASSLKET